MDHTEQELSIETEAYAEAILFPEFAEKYDPNYRPPVWAESRNDLLESLEYFRVLKQVAYRRNGSIYGFLVDGDCGERCYIDSEVVIARVDGLAGSHSRLTRRTRTHPEDQDSSDVIVQAFYQTKQMGLPVVLILGSKCTASPVRLVDRYSVMDHFRISHIWAEKSVRGKASYKARFDRIAPCKAWWTPNQPEPPLHRYPSAAVVEMPCTFCNTLAPQIYAKSWLCTNPSCAFFWHTIDGSEAPEDLVFDRKYLKQRLPDIPWFRPGFDLVPDLMSNLLTLRETGQITAALRSLWRGIVCPQCRKCNPRVYWNVWTCDNCDIDYPPDPGYIELQSVITRTTVSFIGHPMISPEWPKADFAYHGPFFRQHYRVERWILHENSSITLISPTATFNEETNGPNALWDEMLASANLGNLGLRRGIIRQDGLRTSHFFNHFGAEYDTSDVSSTPLDEAPLCVTQSIELLNQAGQAELGHLYEWPNQVSVNGFWSDMGLAWHTDGEGEIGSTISTLSLGGDATMHIRLQMSYYHNHIDMMNADPIMGALDWRNLTDLKRRWEAGEISDEEYAINPDTLARMKGKLRPEISLPLIHGSIVIMTGKALSKYYEHSIEVMDSIRFSVTCRTIDEKARARILDGGRVRVQRRLAGQKFMTSRDTAWDLVDNAEPDSSDHDEDGEDDNQPTGMVKEKPLPRKPDQRTGGQSAQDGGRSSIDRSRSASPSGTKRRGRRYPNGSPRWPKEDDDKLKRLVGLLGHKWSEIAEDFPGKSPAACRLHYMLIGKDYDPTVNRKPKGEVAKGKEKVTEGSKSARSSRRKRGRKDSEQSFR